MSIQARRELLLQVACRYREARRTQRRAILDEFVASTGYSRKYAIRLLTRPVKIAVPIRHPDRSRPYGADVQEALITAWMSANCVCAKRLVPFLPELLGSLEQHSHLVIADDVRAKLLSMSAATADRILGPVRRQGRSRGNSTTRAGKLLKHQIPVRTFADWNDGTPGFMEADLVAHCGPRAEGAFLHTLVLTDVATGWTEFLPLLHRSSEAVVSALGRMREVLPLRLLGLDTDNGSEFINSNLLEYCRAETITFTRGRSGKKNDACFVEQKNGVTVRQFVGYDRFEGQDAYQQLTELYGALRLYVNFFQPSMKLRSKRRDGAKVNRTYDKAMTPFQRVLASGVLPEATTERMGAVYRALDPVRLLRQIEALQNAVWRHAITPESPRGSDRGDRVEFIPSMQRKPLRRADVHPAAMPGDLTSILPLSPDEIAGKEKRKYRKSGKPRAPHTWRTRKDPFLEVWEIVRNRLNAEPERTAKSILQELQREVPGSCSDGQLRTLQRRVKEWRKQTILAFDKDWLEEEVAVGAVLPRALRPIPRNPVPNCHQTT